MAFAPHPTARGASANERVRIGVMGLGGRGTFLAQSFAGCRNAEIVYICDVDTRRLPRASEAVARVQGRAPKAVQDFRRILDDRDIDVLINATPDHWHALGSILACQAGKDVYVEKPMTHNAWEGRKMIEAAEKHGRIVQVGMQSRSAKYLADAADYIRSGQLGDVPLVRVFQMTEHPVRRRTPAGPATVPAGYDHDTWCGPAPLAPYDPGRHWLTQWEYSCGPIAGDAVHQLDLARYLMGDPAFPDTVVNTGRGTAFDPNETPDTQVVAYEYRDRALVFEAALWTPYLTKTPHSRRDKDVLPNWPFNSIRIEVLGTKGFMYFGRHGDGWQVFNDKAEPVVTQPGRQADREHQENLLECVRTRKQPAANVRQGHYTAMLCHLANISYRTGNRKLAFDGGSETFKQSPEANRYLKRTYRPPFVVPDIM